MSHKRPKGAKDKREKWYKGGTRFMMKDYLVSF